MNRRYFINEGEPQGFPFIFGHPYFQATNINDFDEVYEIHEPIIEADVSKDKLHEDIESLDTKEMVDLNQKYAMSLSSERLKIDPNYKWLLKDLNLSNDTRVIDVTDILEKDHINEPENEHNDPNEDEVKDQQDEEQKETNSNHEYDPVELFYPNNEQATSLNNTSRDLDDVTINTNTVEAKQIDEEDDEDHQNDHNFINKLYQKLVKPVYDNESSRQNETIEDNESETDYDNHNESHNSEVFQNKTPSESENEEPVKRNSKFSKSFEVSLSSMDNLIDRLDNGIKLKRNKNVSPKESEKKKAAENNEESSKIVESLKQEWSNMFSKLENDYKSKLDEQQKLNDMRLKSLHEEIKKCMFEQEKFITKQNKPEMVEIIPKKTDQIDNLKSTMTISETSKGKLVDASTSTNDTLNPNVITDNAKYISNLRSELKSKHTRHMQDLRDYYDREIDDLKKKLELYETKYGMDIENNQNKDDDYKDKYEHLCTINEDLKESNADLIHKLEECNEHINYLKQENYELTNNLSQINSKLKYAEGKIQALQDGYNNMEAQLAESIKVQDKYVRELQNEKRNFMKKSQENEDFQMNLKYYEQKCESYELKLDERDTIITRMKAKLAQTETDLNRLEYEYQKLKSSSKTPFTPNVQQPYIASTSVSMKETTNQTSPLQLPIKTQNRYSLQDINITPNANSVLISPRKQSPARQPNQQLTILCNLNPQTNNQYSSSSSSSKSPVPARSRSPSVNKFDVDEKFSNTKPIGHKINSVPASENLIKYQNHLNQTQISNHQHHHHQQQRHTENDDLAAAHSSYQMYNRNKYTLSPRSQLPLQQQQQSVTNGQSFKISDLTPEKQIKYIEKLEHEFDLLMKQRQQLDAKLTRLPYKATNPSMHAIRESIEEELNVVEKKIASVKLELRKLNIIKTH